MLNSNRRLSLSYNWVRLLDIVILNNNNNNNNNNKPKILLLIQGFEKDLLEKVGLVRFEIASKNTVLKTSQLL